MQQYKEVITNNEDIIKQGITDHWREAINKKKPKRQIFLVFFIPKEVVLRVPVVAPPLNQRPTTAI